MKKVILSYISLIVWFTSFSFAITNKIIPDTSEGLHRLDQFKTVNFNKNIYSEYTQYFEKNQCPKNLYYLQNIITKFDQYISKNNNPNLLRNKIHSILLQNEYRAKQLIEINIREYLVNYYDNDLTNDFTSGCLGTPNFDNFWPAIKSGRIKLEGYIKKTNKLVFPSCQFWQWDCDNGFITPSYEFILTKNINILNLPTWNHRKQAWDKIQLWCIFDNRLNVYQYETNVLENTYYWNIYQVSSATTKQLLSSHKDNPISILWWYWFLVDSWTHGHIWNICWGEFRTIDIIN